MIQRSRPLLIQIGVPLFVVQVVVVSALTIVAWSKLPTDVTGSVIGLILIGAIVAVLIPVLAIVFAARIIVRQTQTMATAVARYGQGDFSMKVPAASTAELGELSEALDVMGDRLNTRFAELQLQQRQQRAILQSMGNAVLAVDTEQHIVMVNRAAEQLLGLRSEEIQGRMLQEVIRQPQLHEFVRKALADPARQEQELRLHGESPMVVQARSGPLTSADGAPVGLLMVLNDVTELRRLESLRSEFAANVSHELRTPITNLKGYVETLLEVGTDDVEQTSKFLGIIQHNINRLAAIVDDVMALTEFERPKSSENLERQPTAVRDIFSYVVEQFQGRADVKHNMLTLSIDGELSVLAKPGLIEQAVGNLVANAITYSPAGTAVRLEAAALPGEEIEIAVVDEGPGIAEQHLSRLFERFYRVDSARSREAGGTGLGLAIVKHIAASHGGRVDVTSTLGHGSRFVIILPRA